MMTFKSTIWITFVICGFLMSYIEGRKGCDAYGHACYGGHGKRSEDSGAPSPYQTADNNLPIALGQYLRDYNNRGGQLNRPLSPVAAAATSGASYYNNNNNKFYPANYEDFSDDNLKLTTYALMKQLMEKSRARQSLLQDTESNTIN